LYLIFQRYKSTETIDDTQNIFNSPIICKRILKTNAQLVFTRDGQKAARSRVKLRLLSEWRWRMLKRKRRTSQTKSWRIWPTNRLHHLLTILNLQRL